MPAPRRSFLRRPANPVTLTFTSPPLTSRLTLQAFFILTAIAAGVGGVAWLISYNHRLQKQQHLERRVQARKLDWTYSGERDGRVDYRFAGAGGAIEWHVVRQ